MYNFLWMNIPFFVRTIFKLWLYTSKAAFSTLGLFTYLDTEYIGVSYKVGEHDTMPATFSCEDLIKTLARSGATNSRRLFLNCSIILYDKEHVISGVKRSEVFETSRCPFSFCEQTSKSGQQ